MFTVAHLSDPHLGPLPEPSLAALLNKRMLGYFSWKTRRRIIHREDVLEVLAQDIANRSADHVVVTGDITNIALPEEFEQAARWLRTLGDTAQVSVIPGNHDAYTSVAWEDSLSHWTPFMSNGGGCGDPASAFPYVRERGPVAIVGISTAQPTPPFFASGRVGKQQLRALGDILTRLARHKLFRIVLIHHPPLSGSTAWRKRLSDSGAFRDIIARHGAELVLHGHTHRSQRGTLPTPTGHATVIGVTSASASHDYEDGRHARYHLYGIEEVVTGWRVNVEVRQLATDNSGFVADGSFNFEVSR